MVADFFTVEVWTPRGLQRYIVLFFIKLSTRRVEVAEIASVANGLWMSQIAQNISDTVDGLVKGSDTSSMTCRSSKSTCVAQSSG